MRSRSTSRSTNDTSTALLGEEVLPPSSPSLWTSWATWLPTRKRSIFLTFLSLFIGLLITNVAFNLTSLQRDLRTYELLRSNPSNQVVDYPVNSHDDSPWVAGNSKALALVSFNKHSRAELLDCYLQQNLVQNGGLLERVIFMPETRDYEELEWLKKTVSQVDGYHLLTAGDPEDAQLYDGMAEKLISFSEGKTIKSSLGKSWMVAHSISKAMQASGDQSETLWLFIGAETIYLSPEMVASMFETHQTRPEYAFVHANVVNQQSLSWVHNKLGAAKPYRPDVASDTHSQASHNDSQATVSSWRASELPLWSIKNAKALEPTSKPDLSPTLFGVPVDFQAPPGKHRWLPFDPRAYPDPSADKHDGLDFHQRTPMSKRVNEDTFDSSGPGIWPWTMFAQQLYSFLEHLEEEENIRACARSNGTEREPLGRKQGLARYRFPLWACDNEAMALSVFLVSASDIDATLQNSNFFPTTANDSGMEDWLLTNELTRANLQYREAVVDGHAIAARFAPDITVRSADKHLGPNLEKTDLLDRFHAYGQEVGCQTSVQFRRRQ